ncbi:MAG: hypothetical protein QM764_14925 [Chitinophagaceae bacterium]
MSFTPLKKYATDKGEKVEISSTLAGDQNVIHNNFNTIGNINAISACAAVSKHPFHFKAKFDNSE